MKSKRYKKAMAVAMAVLFLVGCTKDEQSASSGRKSSVSSSMPSANSLGLGGVWDTISLSDTRYNIDTVGNIPELQEVGAKEAVAANIAQGYELIDFIEEKGLNHPLVQSQWQGTESEERKAIEKKSALLNYLFYRQAESGTNPDYPEGILKDGANTMYTIAQEDLLVAAEQYLADPFAQEKMQYIAVRTLPSKQAETVEVWSYPFTKDWYSSEYRIGWVDAENLRYLLVTDFVGGSYDGRQRNDIMQLTFEKSEDEMYRLLDGKFQKDTSAIGRKTAPENMVEWQDVSMASRIIGGIRNNFITLGEWDKNIFLYALDQKTQEVSNTVSIQEDLLGYRFKGDQLFLYFTENVYVLDENLDIVAQTAVPTHLAKLIQERPDSPWDATVDMIYVSGYDVTTDLSMFVYSTNEGAFLYNQETGETTKFYEPTLFLQPVGEIGIYLKNISGAFFTEDNSGVYGFLPSEEDGDITDSPLFYYDIATAESDEWDARDYYPLFDESLEARDVLVNTFAAPINRGLLEALRSTSFYPGIILGQEYFFVDAPESDGTNVLYIGSFANPSTENLTKIEMENGPSFCTILSDRQLLMKYHGSRKNRQEYGVQYFIFDVSSYLPQ